MNRFLKSVFLVAALSVLVAWQALAQDSLFQSPLSFGIEVGVSAHSLSGEARPGIDAMIRGQENPAAGNYHIKGSVEYMLSPLYGVFVDWRPKGRLAVGVGLRFITRGYTAVVSGEEKDPEYQYDETFEYRESLRISNFELPLTASYLLGRRISVRGGLMLGYGVGKAPKVKVSMDEKTIINGEEADVGDRFREEEIVLADSGGKVYGGIIASLDYRILRPLSLSASYVQASNYATVEGYGKLSDHSVSLTLKYLLLGL